MNRRSEGSERLARAVVVGAGGGEVGVATTEDGVQVVARKRAQREDLDAAARLLLPAPSRWVEADRPR